MICWGMPVDGRTNSLRLSDRFSRLCDLRCDLDSLPLRVISPRLPLRAMIVRLPLRAMLPRHPLQVLHPILPLRALLLGLPFGVMHQRLLLGVTLQRLPAGRSFQQSRLKASAHRLQSDGQLRGVAALAQVAGEMALRTTWPARDWARTPPLLRSAVQALEELARTSTH